MYVRDIKCLLVPVFESMLSDGELETLTLRIVLVSGGPEGEALPDDVAVATNEAWARWQICGEKGGSGSLAVHDGLDSVVGAVQSDLQDFIAESRFGWGELRGQSERP